MQESGAQQPTSMGMQANVAAGLSYVLGFITGLIFYLVEKENRFVRFHAMQSMVVFGGLFLLNIALSILTGMLGLAFLFLAGILSTIIGLAALVLWILLMIKAFQGEYFKLPWVGDKAEELMGRAQLA